MSDTIWGPPGQGVTQTLAPPAALSCGCHAQDAEESQEAVQQALSVTLQVQARTGQWVSVFGGGGVKGQVVRLLAQGFIPLSPVDFAITLPSGIVQHGSSMAGLDGAATFPGDVQVNEAGTWSVSAGGRTNPLPILGAFFPGSERAYLTFQVIDLDAGVISDPRPADIGLISPGTPRPSPQPVVIGGPSSGLLPDIGAQIGGAIGGAIGGVTKPVGDLAKSLTPLAVAAGLVALVVLIGPSLGGRRG